MTKLGGLGLQIPFVMGIAIYLQRNALDDLDPSGSKLIHLARIVGHEPQTGYANMIEHGLATFVAAHISRKPQLLVGFDRVCALVLELVGPNLAEQTNATAFLPKV